MSQEFNKIALTDKINSSLSVLLKRDETSLTLSAGEQEPQDIEAGMEGRLCLRTDLKVLKILTSVNPVVWETLIDFGANNATKEWVEENFQPLNSNLTALSNILSQAYKVPYFDSQNTMSTFDITGFGTEILNSQSAADIRNMLELRTLATIDKIDQSNVDSVIVDSSITKEKLAFEPITSEQGYTTGDIKENYNEDDEPGWITLLGGIKQEVEHKEIIYGCFLRDGKQPLYVEAPYHINDPIYVTKDSTFASKISQLVKHPIYRVYDINPDGTIDVLLYDGAISGQLIIDDVPNYPDGDLTNTWSTSYLEGIVTVGNIDSGSTYKGQDYNDLFTKIWSSNAVSFQDSTGKTVSRGDSANADWNSNKRLVLPSTFKGINPNCCYKIKI